MLWCLAVKIVYLFLRQMKSKKLGYCNISLPEWSLEGDGYTVSIQKKVI